MDKKHPSAWEQTLAQINEKQEARWSRQYNVLKTLEAVHGWNGETDDVRDLVDLLGDYEEACAENGVKPDASLEATLLAKVPEYYRPFGLLAVGSGRGLGRNKRDVYFLGF